ncbi:RNA polymerase sigma-70 factor (ECF subfamily) [Tenacibaculum skagerrakense]|uniref:RNA polymerase sigma-70 factor (ECF subfamily) n=1 Tax=Tenacibaculum skagerrakense TaxID=186571 RepID=A0A4R2NRP0_9FLAO|nr:RNA polymerase sigma factor [Tenacibaculum skagerrakense]TCP24402.1 RNA polymerase sigma-70 factor (ECF subfamily) [Tenacibaculum skagerrakense]
MKNKDKEIDAKLILDYQSGDSYAFVALVNRWHVWFCKLANWYVKDTAIAKDIAQDSWTVIYHKLTELKDPYKFKSWAISIVNRKAIDFLRDQQRTDKRIEEYQLAISKNNEENEEADDEVKVILLKEIKNLSIDHQQVLQLFYVQNYLLKEIAEVLGISVGTTKSRLFHAREQLKKVVIKYRKNGRI